MTLDIPDSHRQIAAVTDLYTAEIEKALKAGDEARAAARLAALDANALSQSDLPQLITQARLIDRNDIALRFASKLEQGPQNKLFSLHLRMERGEAVADEMKALVTSSDANDPVLLPLVGALEGESRGDEAVQMLEHALATSPEWIVGHQTLVQMRWTMGDRNAADDMAKAVAAHPNHELMTAAYLGTLKSLEDHARLKGAVSDGLARFPQSQLVRMVSAEALSEMGKLAEADRLFADLAQIADPDFDAARMRHLMRAGRPQIAAQVGARAVATHGLPECWAWMGAALRLLDDPRADWYYRGEDLLSVKAIDFTEEQRIELAALLRSLHNAAGPPYGQSPRGGTQTLGHLLKRREPIIIALRAALLERVRDHIAALPPIEPQHPILSRSRQIPMFEGAWSILLRGGGHHVSHIHSRGWISSAIYVDVPEALTQASDQQGWLQIGVPPITGGASMEPLMKVAPKPLHLALFPSLFWHGTMPFDDGERLTVAFDIIGR